MLFEMACPTRIRCDGAVACDPNRSAGDLGLPWTASEKREEQPREGGHGNRSDCQTSGGEPHEAGGRSGLLSREGQVFGQRHVAALHVAQIATCPAAVSQRAARRRWIHVCAMPAHPEHPLVELVVGRPFG